jgi:hypothetical protein
MQSRNQLCLPPMFLERTVQVLFGEDRKSRSSDCFSVVASLSVHRFDLAFAYDVISILHFVCLIKKKKIWGEFAGFFSLGLLDIACTFA